jgi:putative hydrolase of the HAD superfamily
MIKITALFWDVGGVLLTNGWDVDARQRAVKQFNLDREDFERRHHEIFAEFEKGHLGLEEYLRHTIFYTDRTFDKDQFQNFMFQQSRPRPDALRLAGSVRQTNDIFMAALNNESRELNDYRIRTFGLGQHFDAFFSSCYTGTRKPEAGIYRAALDISRKQPGEVLFIDDRPWNLETAERLGLSTIRFRDVDQLREELADRGVVRPPAQVQLA